MFSYATYKVIHLTGILMIFLAYGSILLNGFQGGGKKWAHRKLPSITHGVGLFIALIGGFGLLVRTGVEAPWPLWIWLKLSIWIFYGFASPFVRKSQQVAKILWFVIIGLGVMAIYLANFKPL